MRPRKRLLILAAAGLLAAGASPSRADECPTKESSGKPLTILFDNGARVNILGNAQDVLYYDAISRDGISTRMAAASGLFTLSSVGPAGVAWFRYEAEPRLAKPLAKDDVIVAAATVSRIGAPDYRMSVEIMVDGEERIAVANCSFDVFLLTTTIRILDGARVTGVSTIVRYFQPDLRLTLRTVGPPRAAGSGLANPTVSAIGFQ